MTTLSKIQKVSVTSFRMSARQRSTEVVHGEQRVAILKRYMIDMDIFLADPNLLLQPYNMKCQVGDGDFDLFVKAVKGEVITVDNANVNGLVQLCSEVGFHGLDKEIDAIAGKTQVLGNPRLGLVRFNENINEITTVFENLTTRVESIEKMLNTGGIIDELCTYVQRVEQMTTTLARDVQERLGKAVILVSNTGSSAQTPEVITQKRTEFKLENGLFNGIIKRLRAIDKHNPAGTKSIDLTSSPVDESDPYQGTEYENVLEANRCCYVQRDIVESGKWLCMDFKTRKVLVTHYSLCSGSMKSWVLEGSCDGSVWDELDRRCDNNDMKEEPSHASFAVSNPGEYTFIRLMQTGKTHGDTHAFILRRIELFGTLIE